jgi:hypothetical protein
MLGPVFPAEIDASLATEHRLTERQGQVHDVILPLDGARATALEKGRPPTAAEQAAEDVAGVEAELTEHVADIEVAVDVFLTETLMKAGLAELVVLATFVGIGEHRVRFGDLLETFFGLFIPGVFVRMIFQCEFPVGFFDGVGIGVFGNAQNGIIVFGHDFS